MAVKLEHRIGIQAPAEVIWESLIDVEGWPAWSQLYPRAAGIVRIGNTLSLDLALPGHPVQTITPTILDWAPEDHIHWTTRSRFGLLKTVRYLEIEVLTETGCIFSNGEIYDGYLGPSYAGRNRRALRAGFAAMGEALQERAEAAWRERQSVTT
ncbi:MAG TPA: SRPBCC domain-containing protein [Caulobacteraceae bacterium]